MSKADQQVKFPSIGVRFPGNKRRDGKKLTQSLLEIKGRVKQEDFFKWIYQFEDKKPKKEKKIIIGEIYTGALDISKIPKDIKNLLENGVTEDRNATWFYIACRIAKIGFEMHNVINYLDRFYLEEKDFKRKEWEGCIKSAYKRVQGEIYVKEN